MRKLLHIALVLMCMLSFTACRHSKIEATVATAPDGSSITVPSTTAWHFEKSTQEYHIPEGASQGINGGPGEMSAPADTRFASYPEDKKVGESVSGQVVVYYSVDETLLECDFDLAESVNADTIIGVMINNGVLAEDTKIEAFSVQDGKGVLKLNKLQAGFGTADDKLLSKAVANSFIDNLLLENLKLSTDSKDYGEMTFTKE